MRVGSIIIQLKANQPAIQQTYNKPQSKLIIINQINKLTYLVEGRYKVTNYVT